MKHKRTIRYLGVDPASSDDSQTILKYYAVNVEGQSIKLYLNALQLISRLTKEQMVFLFFLFQEADLQGWFKYKKSLRDDFRTFSKNAGLPKYSARTIARWINQMTEMEILNKKNVGRGEYTLSPVFFGSDIDYTYNNRERELRKSLEKPIKNLAAKVRAEVLAEKELYETLKDFALTPREDA